MNVLKYNVKQFLIIDVSGDYLEIDNKNKYLLYDLIVGDCNEK